MIDKIIIGIERIERIMIIMVVIIVIVMVIIDKIMISRINDREDGRIDVEDYNRDCIDRKDRKD